MPTSDSTPAEMSSANTPRWLSNEEQQTWRSFLFGARAMLRAIDKQLTRDSNLSGAEYDVLVPLSEAPDGVLRSRALLEFLGWERSRLSHLLVRMDRRGLIERNPCDDDARGLDVAITPNGRKAIEAAAPAHLELVRAALMDDLTAEEARAINSIQTKLSARLRELDLD